ncbi:MAG: methyltransferase domain-containing protein [Acidimicrobiales bacterium]
MTSLVGAGGEALELPVDRWHGPPDEVELALLDGLPDPVLDVGCGPGRIVAALGAVGRPALGVDPSPAAVAEARRRRAPVLARSVFGLLPGEGRWGTVLLLDGNIGIGGDPEALLTRAGHLVRPGGQVVAEVEPPGAATRSMTTRLESARGVSPWFAWARVGADRFEALVTTAGLQAIGLDVVGARWFGRAVRS